MTVEIYTKSEIDSLLPTTSTPPTIPRGDSMGSTLSVYYLLRQSPDFTDMLTPAGLSNNYDWPGACLSCSTQNFFFSLGLRPIKKAFLMLYWIPRSRANSVELVKFDNNVVNIETMANVYSNAQQSPVPGGVEITAEMQALVAAKVDKQIGWRVAGDPSNPPSFFLVKMEVYWE